MENRGSESELLHPHPHPPHASDCLKKKEREMESVGERRWRERGDGGRGVEKRVRDRGGMLGLVTSIFSKQWHPVFLDVSLP